MILQRSSSLSRSRTSNGARRLPRRFKSALPFASHVEQLESRVLYAAVDPTYGQGGFAFGPQTDSLYDGAAASDGSAYVLHQTWRPSGIVRITKFTAGGQLDTRFAGDGTFEINAGGMALLCYVDVDTAGRAYVLVNAQGTDSVQFSRTTLYRLTTDGQLDTSFGGGDGKVEAFVMPGGNDRASFARMLDVRPDGDIVVAADVRTGVHPETGVPAAPYAAFERYNADGSIDTAFGTGGRTLLDEGGSFGQLQGVTVDAQDRIVFSNLGGVADSALPSGERVVSHVGRLTVDGILDTSFGTAGYVQVPLSGPNAQATVARIYTDTDGRVYGVGGTGFINPLPGEVADLGVYRFNTDGTIDTTWGAGGFSEVFRMDGRASRSMDDAFVSPAGKFIAVSGDASTWSGEDYAMRVLALDASGAYDTSVVPDGYAILRASTSCGSVSLYDDNHAILFGTTLTGEIVLTKLDLTAAFPGTTPTPEPVPTEPIDVPTEPTEGSDEDDGSGEFVLSGSSDDALTYEGLGFFDDKDDDLLDRAVVDVLV